MASTTTLDAPLPRVRDDLVISPAGRGGGRVVKDLRSGAYFDLGPEEAFLLARLDGEADADDVRTAFEARFGEPLAGDDLEDFVVLVRERGLVRDVGPADEVLDALRAWPIPGAGPEPAPGDAPAAAAARRSVLFFKVHLFDPKWLFDRAEPRLRFVWTRAFLAASALVVVAGGLTAWTGRDGFVNQFAEGWGPRTAVLACLALAVATALHEAAHGLTCKHFGGEVRDTGFLLLYFIPCFYCNVSDAWLFPERWKRLAVTLAGPWCDLVLWAVGVLAWRVTQPGTPGHDFAWFVATLCGVRMFLNANPLIPMDGYYAVSDLAGVSNLRGRGLDRFKARLRWLLWGARRPAAEPGGALFLGFGAASWVFSLVFLSLTIWGLAAYAGARASVMGLGWAAFLGTASARRLFRGFSKGEATAMVRERRGRVKAWMFAAGCGALALAALPVPDRAGGTFQVRPSARAEVRAPVAGFLREVAGDEGSFVSVGERLARLDVPDLPSKLAQKQAERRESEARLRLLEIGPRPEAVEEQKRRADRAKVWHDLARQDLARTKEALKGELAEINALAAQYKAEADRAADALQRDRALLTRRALQVDQFQETQKVWKVAVAQLTQAEARRHAREAEGALKAESELARRESEAAEAASALRLLEAGSRPEEVEAERAHLARVAEEVRALEAVRDRLSVGCPVSGVIATPRLRERIGQYFQEGDLIAEVEAPTRAEAEVSVDEQDVARVRPGQLADLKVRALPFETFRTKVARVATVSIKAQERVAAGPKTAAQPAPPSGASRDAAGAFIVYCDLDDPSHALKTGMTGYARIHLGAKPLGDYLAHRALRVIRTEFWW